MICTEAMILRESGTYNAPGPHLGDGARNQQGDHANWFEFIPHTDGFITIGSCNQGVDTRFFMYQGNCTSLTKIDESDDDCASGGGRFYGSRLSDIPVIKDITYFFEWDDRWSSDAFDIDFIYDYIEVIDLCDNGIKDGDEDDIDCGGSSCRPCHECNTPSPSLTNMIEEETFYRSNSEITVSNVISPDGSLMISSGIEITLESGFEIQIGGQLEALIENCEEYYTRIQKIK